MGPTGGTVVGDILDCNKETLERAIQAYDSLLYFKWNPLKQRGHGIWELRRRPDKKTIVSSVVYKGNTYCLVDYKEHDLEHHVWDLPYLGYDLLQRLKDADQFVHSNYESNQHHRMIRHLRLMDEAHFRVKEEAKAKARADMLYNLKQDKGIIKDFQEKLISGVDPNHLMRFWK